MKPMKLNEWRRRRRRRRCDPGISIAIAIATSRPTWSPSCWPEHNERTVSSLKCAMVIERRVKDPVRLPLPVPRRQRSHFRTRPLIANHWRPHGNIIIWSPSRWVGSARGRRAGKLRGWLAGWLPTNLTASIECLSTSQLFPDGPHRAIRLGTNQSLARARANGLPNCQLN